MHTRHVASILGAALVLTIPVAGSVQASASAHIALPAGSTPLVNVTKTKLGSILTGPNGHTLYRFASEDTSAVAQCTGGCLSAWPALLLPSKLTKPSHGKGVVDTVGTVSRQDISKSAKQITYDGWRLYYFFNDKRPGQTKGENVNHFVVVPATPVVPFRHLHHQCVGYGGSALHVPWPWLSAVLLQRTRAG